MSFPVFSTSKLDSLDSQIRTRIRQIEYGLRLEGPKSREDRCHGLPEGGVTIALTVGRGFISKMYVPINFMHVKFVMSVT